MRKWVTVWVFVPFIFATQGKAVGHVFAVEIGHDGEGHVEVDPIFIKDGDVWTSAGITAGIDMALAMIEDDLGKPAAIAMARSGGQSQFSAELARQAKGGEGRFEALHAWVRRVICWRQPR